jgi:hypothetical protein
VHAAEDGRIPFKRLEDAHKRLRVAKERMLGQSTLAGRSAGPSQAALRQLLGCDEHRRVADDMARDA